MPDEGFYPDIKQYVTFAKDIATTQRTLNDVQLRLTFLLRLIEEEKRENEERGKSVENSTAERNRSTNVDVEESGATKAAGRLGAAANRRKI